MGIKQDMNLRSFFLAECERLVHYRLHEPEKSKSKTYGLCLPATARAIDIG